MLKQMQILCGTLNYCCKVIRGGRIYMHHMIELLKLFNHTDRITLPLSFHDDLSWWITYSNLFNGTADFLNPLNSTEEIFTDACLDGVGGIYKNDYYQGLIIPSGDKTLSITPIGHHNYNILVPIEQCKNINVSELVSVMIALRRWNSSFINSRVLINCDNLQVCYMLCKDRSANTFANACLKTIFWNCVSTNMYLSPCFIPSSANYVADVLSRSCIS